MSLFLFLFVFLLDYYFEYSSKLANKFKGSGHGINVMDKFQFTKLDAFCNRCPNLETLFIEVTHTKKPISIGVTYRSSVMIAYYSIRKLTLYNKTCLKKI